MAKKSAAKKEKIETPTNIVETVVNDIIEDTLPVEVVELKEKVEELKPTEDFVNEVIANPETAQDVLAEQLEKLDKIEELVQEEMQKVVASTPKKNSQFTYMWNGMNLY